MAPWFFRDRAGAIQGPFGDEEMRAWYEAGYLAADLLISADKMNWAQLTKWFPNGMYAFLPAVQVQQLQAQAQAQAMMAQAQMQAQAGQWYFVDKNGKVQGPFSDTHMRQWHMAGYFEPSLQVINNASPSPQWQMLRDAFPNLADAFLTVSAGQGSGAAAMRGGAAAASPAAAAKPVAAQQSPQARFEFPKWLPVPPKFRGVKKTYPSEKNNGARRQRVNITDLHGQQVNGFTHVKS